MSVSQERYIERNAGLKVRQLWPGTLWVKMRAVGFPDRMVIFPNGNIVFIEFKTPKGTLEPQQDAVIGILRKLRVNVYVCTSTTEAVAVCKRHAPAPAPSKRRNPRA